jgi:hypothetical protein
VLKKASEDKGVKGVSLWYDDIPLNCDHLFADCFEPDAIYRVKVRGNYPEGSLLNSNEAKLRPLGVDLAAPQLLMEAEELKWSMEEFLMKASDFAPTLILIRLENGAECGGVAGVPWPKLFSSAADPAKDSFIFSLGATPGRFDLVRPDNALYCDGSSFEFGFDGDDLYVWSDGDGCGSNGQLDYTGPREPGELVGATGGVYRQPYESWELWRL